MILTLAAGTAAAQTAVEDLHFRGGVLSRFGDTTGPGISTNYVFSKPAPGFKVSSKLEFKLPWNADQHTFLLGPQATIALGRRFSFHSWALAGNAKRFALMEPLAAPTDATPPHFGLPGMPVNSSFFNGANEKTMSLGGSLDYRVTDHLTYRPAQLDYLLMQNTGRVLHDARWSTGVRLSFGK